MTRSDRDIPRRRRQSLSPLAPVALGLGVLAAVTLLAAGPGSRLGWWHFGTGFTLLRWAVYGGLAAAGVGILGMAHARPGSSRRGLWMAAVAVGLGLGTAYVPWSQLQTAREVPPIHDITTDTEDPPEFVEVVPLREDAPNPVEYGGPEVARQQREAYPDIRTVELEVDPARAFAAALDAAREMGWEIVAADPEEGRIEATATTFWFGFEDDVVVRIRPAPGDPGTGQAAAGRTELDVRSLSRVGGSDVGANARRIREYVGALEGELSRAAGD